MARSNQNEFGNWRETFVKQLYRLFKVCRLHELDNEAADTAMKQAAGKMRQIFEADELEVDLMDVIFAGDNIFVNGKPLRASRDVYATILELGDLLAEVGFNDITISPGINQDDIKAMLETYLERRDNPHLRDKDNVINLGETVRYRRIDPKKLLDLDDDDLTAEEQVLRLYPAAVVLLRRFTQNVREQDFAALRFVKRISQRLVALSDSAAETLLAVTAMRKTRDEPGGIAVNSGVLAMLIARHLSDSYRTLQRVCFGAMVADIGRPRAAGVYQRQSTPNVIPKLNMSGKEQLGPSNALLLLRNGRVRQPTLRRAIIAYEAGWLMNEQDIGWPFGDKRQPSIESFIVRVSRRFWDLMALKPSMKKRRTPQAVLDILLKEADSRIERSIVHLLMETIAFYEKGAMVETSTGWRGVVARPGQRMADFPRPVVRMVRDPSGNAIDPQDVDLTDENVNLKRFGLVRKSLKNANDKRLRQVANQLRPSGWKERHSPPSEKSRERKTTSKKKKRPKKKPKKQRKKPKTKPKKSANENSSSPDNKPSPPPVESKQPGLNSSSEPPPVPEEKESNLGAGGGDSKPRPSSAKNSAVTSGSMPSVDRSKSKDLTETSSPAPKSYTAKRTKNEDKRDPDDPSVILEFGPGKVNAMMQPTGRQESDAGQGGDEQGRSSGPHEGIEEISASEIEPAGAAGEDELDEISASGVEPIELGHSGDAEPIELEPEPLEPEPIELEPEPIEGDEQDPPDAGSPSESNAGESVGRFDQETRNVSSDESADVLGGYVDESEEPTREARAEGEGGLVNDYVQQDDQGGADQPMTGDDQSDELRRLASDSQQTGSGSFDGSTRQMSRDESSDILEQFVEEAPESDEDADTTRRVGTERSQELLRSYVGQTSPDEPKDSLEEKSERLDELAADLDENTSPEEVKKTERVSSEKSHELLRSFVEEVPSHVEESPDEQEESPEDSRLGELASDIDATSIEEHGNSTKTVDSGRSKNLLQNYVDKTPSDAQESGEAPGSGTHDATETVSNEESKELLQSFVEEVPEDEDREQEPSGKEKLGDLASDIDATSVHDHDKTETVSSERSQELLQSFVEEVPSETEKSPEDSRLGEFASEIKDDSTETSGATRAVSSEKSREVLRDYVDGISDEHDAASPDSIEENPDDSRLGELVSNIEEEEPPSDKDATRTMSSEQSREVLNDYVDDTPEAGETSREHDRAKFKQVDEIEQTISEERARTRESIDLDRLVGEQADAEGEEGFDSSEYDATQTISDDRSEEVLQDFVEEVPEDEEEEDEHETRRVDSQRSSKLLKNYVDESDDES